MFEKVNPMHPDKVADRIAGSLVDYAYTKQDDPKVAIEVLIGHGDCHILAETSVKIPLEVVKAVVWRITSDLSIQVDYKEVPQDVHLAENQKDGMRCGDNGIFRGVPASRTERKLSEFAKRLYERFPTDGKFIIEAGAERDYFTICQSGAADEPLRDEVRKLIAENDVIRALNPLGAWTGGLDVDSGATNRKLGSDMGRAVTGGGLHGKDLSKADVSINIYAHLLAQQKDAPVALCCAIGDEKVNGVSYPTIVEIARRYVKSVGGFEGLAEWGLI